MTRRRHVWLAVAAGLWGALLARGVAAQETGGTSVLPFFLEPLDAARAALGGTQPARSGDVAALFSNPAGTSRLAREGFVAHAELDQGLRLEAAALSFPLGGGGGTLSLGFAYAHLGGLEARDESGAATGGSLSYGASVLRVAYARDVARSLSVGLAAEHLYQGIDGQGGSGFALGLGALLRTPALDFAVALDHLGPDLKAGEARTPSPRAIRAGLRLHPGRAVDLLAEVSRSGEARATGAAGLEYSPVPTLALRAGYRRELGGTLPLSGLSGGLGFTGGRWTADYAMILDQGQGTVHRLSLRLGLGLPRIAP